jgi:hypothetical protein
MATKRRFSRAQRTTIVNGVICFLLVLAVLQLWLLTATMNAFLGGDSAIVGPAFLASAVCLLLGAGLLRYI